jgi:hypothetical protein
MPISNPLLTINPYRSAVRIETADPSTAPVEERTFWLNITTNKLWVAIATNSPSDWRAIATDATGEIDAASILNKILVQDGQVLTTDDHVIFED